VSLVQLAAGSVVAIPATEWARLLSQGPTDVVTQPGSRLLVFPDSWGPADVAAALGASQAVDGGTPTGAPPA
jgi:hypothetical protein